MRLQPYRKLTRLLPPRTLQVHVELLRETTVRGYCRPASPIQINSQPPNSSSRRQIVSKTVSVIVNPCVSSLTPLDFASITVSTLISLSGIFYDLSMMNAACPTTALGGLSRLGRGGLAKCVELKAGPAGSRILTTTLIGRGGLTRCDVGNNVRGVRENIDKATKKDIPYNEILRNQEENESEQRSVFGAKPTSGSLYPRPEVERRPETGPRELGSIFAFDGAVPETVNGRLAMVGIFWAAIAEKLSGLTVWEQLYSSSGGMGLVFYLAVVQVITFASLIPFLNGESTDARSFGPFTAKAERWNGRLAMLGFLALLLTEQFTHTPAFKAWF